MQFVASENSNKSCCMSEMKSLMSGSLHTHTHTHAHTHTHTHTHTHPSYGSLNSVWDNPGELVPEETFTHSHLSWSSVIPYLLPPSITIHGILPIQFACLQSFSTISFQVFFGLPLGQAPSTSNSTHFFTQSLSSFFSTCLYHRKLFCCSTEIMSSNPSLSLNP